MKPFALACCTLLAATAALGGTTTADSCAAGLTKDPRAIYDASVTSVQPSTDLKALLSAKTRGLVLAGTIARGGARDSARAAMECLALKQKAE
jgi:hypothetical protein